MSWLGSRLPSAAGTVCFVAKVTVVGGSPIWQRGMAGTAEEAGYRVTVAEGLSAWAPSAERECIVVAALGGLDGFRERHRYVPILAVLETVDVASVADAIRAGATGVLGADDSPDQMMMAIDRAIDGRVILPADVVAAMARLVPEESDTSSWVSPDEVGWLRFMAAGGTVADLAEDIGYSERAMFRQLKSLYQRLGVRNRTEALLWASQRGLLADDGQ